MEQVVDIEDLWAKVHAQLFGYISKHVKSKDEVNDIIQDTFIKVKTNIDKLINPAKVESWIFQIARNTMNDYFRKQKKTYNNVGDSDEPIIEPSAFDEEDIKVQIQTKEFSQYAGFVVSELPEKYRIAVQMADIEGLSMKEIADELNISVSGAKSRVQRGRKLIKEIILKCCDVNTDKYGNIVDYERRNCNNPKKC
jgi:RNA polymerase sigma-70 factor (ECF subfamily)